MKSEFKQEYLNRGRNKLELILFDEFYEVQLSSEKIKLTDFKRKNIIIEQNTGSVKDILLFSRYIYNILISTEQDESIISAANHIVFGINNRLKRGRELPPQFSSAYSLVLEISPEVFPFSLNKLFQVSVSDLDKCVRNIEVYTSTLRKGIPVFINYVSRLINLARSCGLGDVFTYNNDHYCTVYPFSQKFKKDLETAMEMLS